MISKTKKLVVWTIIFILALFWLAIAGPPFLFMVLTAFKEQFEVLTMVYLPFLKVSIK